MDRDSERSDQGNEPNLFRPDDVISPGGAVVVDPLPISSTEPNLPPPAEPVVAAQTTGASFESDMPSPTGGQMDGGAVTWTASEFITHSKTSSWYVLLGAGSIVIAAVIWLLTRDVFATTAVLFGMFLLIAYSARKPREEAYALDDYGIAIGQRRYGYDEFRSFAIVPEGAFLSIELAPLKRFAMYTTIYFDPADAEKIIDRLSYYLPMEDPRNSLTDSFMRRIHF